MADTLNATERSERMGRVRSTNTKPELVVRKIVRALGYRYRLHAPELPGKPDLVFRGAKKAIFVHGCFWHRHSAATCKLARLPKSKLEFWLNKLEGNRLRDQSHLRVLRKCGWSVLQIWECQLKDKTRMERRLQRFLA